MNRDRLLFVFALVCSIAIAAGCAGGAPPAPPAEEAEGATDAGSPADSGAAPADRGATPTSQPSPANTKPNPSYPSQAAPAPRAAAAPQPSFVTVSVPAGTEIEVEILDSLSSGTSQVGDAIRARLTRDLMAGGRLVAPAGAEVTGRVTEAVPLKKFGGQPSLTVVFDSLKAENGETVAFAATFVQAGKKQAGRDAAKIGGAAAAGAVIGHQVDDDKGTALGAIVGGAIGTAVAAKTGKDVEIPSGTVAIVAIENDLSVRLES